MGESESKFRPEPQDVWHKMRSKTNQPRFLQSTMQAIVDLRLTGNSTYCNIVDYLQGIIHSRKITPRPRALAIQVKKALQHGLDNGLIKYRSGKFLLSLSAKDFDIFKSFRSYDPIFGQRKRNKKQQLEKCICKLNDIHKKKIQKRKLQKVAQLAGQNIFSSLLSMMNQNSSVCRDEENGTPPGSKCIESMN